MHDSFDEKIIQCLANNGRITINEISEKINLSQTPVTRRLKKLEADGIIKGYSSCLFYRSAAYHPTAFYRPGCRRRLVYLDCPFPCPFCSAFPGRMRC